MPHRVPHAKRRTTRKLFFAALCLAVATIWNALRPAPVHAELWCSEECAAICNSLNLQCAGIWNGDYDCYFWCY